MVVRLKFSNNRNPVHEHVHDHVNVHVDVHVIVDLVCSRADMAKNLREQGSLLPPGG
jgi:hypothetical protein